MTEGPVSRRKNSPRPLVLVLAALAAVLTLSLAAAGPGAAHAHAQQEDPANAPIAPGGGVAPGDSPGDAADNLRGGGADGGGWDPLISTLQSIVPIAGAIGLLVGIGIWGLAGPNSAQKAVGLGVIGTAGLGLIIGSLAADFAALFTQWI